MSPPFSCQGCCSCPVALQPFRPPWASRSTGLLFTKFSSVVHLTWLLAPTHPLQFCLCVQPSAFKMPLLSLNSCWWPLSASLAVCSTSLPPPPSSSLNLPWVNAQRQAHRIPPPPLPPPVCVTPFRSPPSSPPPPGHSLTLCWVLQFDPEQRHVSPCLGGTGAAACRS